MRVQAMSTTQELAVGDQNEAPEDKPRSPGNTQDGRHPAGMQTARPAGSLTTRGTGS
jgi:hypothetical protein